MKKFLLRLNRGIALALVLIISLSAFLWIDVRRFGGEITAIRDLLSGYIDAVTEMNEFLLTTEGLTESEVRAHINEFADKYFAQSARQTDRWFMTKSDVTQMLTHLSAMIHSERRYIAEDVTFTVSQIDFIRKQDTNAAIIQFRVTANATGESGAGFFNMFQQGSVWNTNIFHVRDGHGYFLEGEEITTITWESRISAVVLKRGGEWRFAEINQWGGGNRVMPTVTTVR
jgi:hypothetical protein